MFEISDDDDDDEADSDGGQRDEAPPPARPPLVRGARRPRAGRTAPRRYRHDADARLRPHSNGSGDSYLIIPVGLSASPGTPTAMSRGSGPVPSPRG